MQINKDMNVSSPSGSSESRLAVIAVVISDKESVNEFNQILHKYGEFIIGRMGLPCRQKKISLISLAVDAPMNIINSLAGSLGRLKGVSIKTVCAPESQT